MLEVAENPGLERIKANNARAHRVRFLRTQNIQLANELEQYGSRHDQNLVELFGGAEATDLLFESRDHRKRATTLQNSLKGCSSHSLFRLFHDGSAGYVTSHTCKAKVCLICNSEKKRKVRRKYWHWAQDNPELVEKHDFMHLTLTVPHTAEHGWRGQQIYSSELLQAFNVMRKYDWWKVLVAGGEFNVEFTRNDAGFHCHIHAMLLLPKRQGSRNELHQRLLKTWNSLTIDIQSEAARHEFTPEQLEGLRKSVGYLDDDQAAKLIGQLSPGGATMVGLESLYVWRKVDGIPKKHYVDSSKPKEFGAGLMECLKYHFEPLCLKKPDKTFDIQLIYAIAPAIYRKVLHGRFGLLRDFKELSVSGKSDLDDLIETVEETGSVVLHPTTGQESDRAEYHFVTADILRIGKRTDHLKLYPDKENLPIYAETVVEAFKIMIQDDLRKRRKTSKSLKNREKDGNSS